MIAIRVPGVIGDANVQWAKAGAAHKKKTGFSAVQPLRHREGLCVQCLHPGPCDAEPATIEAMHRYCADQGYRPDFSEERRHREIYPSDPRRCSSETL